MSHAPSPVIHDTRVDMLAAYVPLNSTICEIGVFKGDFAKQIDTLLKPKELVLADVFTGRTMSGDQDGNNTATVSLDEEFIKLKAYFAEKPYCSLRKGDSSTTLMTFPDSHFDMAYIDGDHSYEGCKRDLIAAYSKVKNGGYIMGHDYETNKAKTHKEYKFGVKRAVDEFCATYKQTIMAKGNDGCVSYAIRLAK